MVPKDLFKIMILSCITTMVSSLAPSYTEDLDPCTAFFHKPHTNFSFSLSLCRCLSGVRFWRIWHQMDDPTMSVMSQTYRSRMGLLRWTTCKGKVETLPSRYCILWHTYVSGGDLCLFVLRNSQHIRSSTLKHIDFCGYWISMKKRLTWKEYWWNLNYTLLWDLILRKYRESLCEEEG